jgi:hypothetical protein
MEERMRFEPSPAERARTVLRAAPSVTVLTMPDRADVIAVHGTDDAGCPLLLVEDTSPLAVAVAAKPEEITAVVHAVDVCPTPMPDRVRAEVWVGGWLSTVPDAERTAAALALADREPAGELLDVGAGWSVLRLEVAEIRIHDRMYGGGQPVDVDPELCAEAKPDPLVDGEADWLGHLVTSHPAEFAQLCVLIPDRLRPPGSCLRPIGLDRYGLVFRVDHTSGPRHARVPFRAPLTEAGQLPRAVHTLLHEAAARCCGH